MPTPLPHNETGPAGQLRRKRQRAIVAQVAELRLGDEASGREVRSRLHAANLSYTPAEAAQEQAEVLARVALAAANNAAEGFALTPKELAEVQRRALVRAGLGS